MKIEERGVEDITVGFLKIRFASVFLENSDVVIDNDPFIKGIALLKRMDNAIVDFFYNKKHGIVHCISVFEKCKQILSKISNESLDVSKKQEALNILMWSSIFHEIARSFQFGESSENSIKICKLIFFDEKNDRLLKLLIDCIKYYNKEFLEEDMKDISEQDILVIDIFKFAHSLG